MTSFHLIVLGSNPGLLPGLVDAALRSLLVAGAVWAGLRLLRAHNVVTQKAAWGLVLAGALFMPMAAPWAAHLPWLPANAMLVLPVRPWSKIPTILTGGHESRPEALPQTVPATVQLIDATAGQSITAASTPHATVASESFPRLQAAYRYPDPTISSRLASRNVTPETTPTSGPMHLPSFGTIAWLLYFAVLGGLLLRLFYGVGAAAGLWLSAEPVDLDQAQDLTQGLSLRSTDKLHSPVTIGSGILLPADYTRWDAEKLRIVLAHERSHVRQGDFYLQLSAGLYAALFWFSPLGWWLKRKLSDLSEAISDRAGLCEAASRGSYAQVLLEFAAMPRTTHVGVAMARPGRLTHRIERLLNESSFHQSFAGGRRMLVVLLLVPAVLFAATALIRVEAASQAPQAPTPPQAPVVAGDNAPAIAPVAPAVAPTPPDVAPVQAEPSAQAPAPPVAPATPAAMPTPPKPPAARLAPDDAPEPPEPLESPSSDETVISNDGHNVLIAPDRHRMRTVRDRRHGNAYFSLSDNGDSYAIIKGNGSQVQMSGNWPESHHEALEKARRMAHGDFLWFSRNGKSYIIEDPAKLAQIESMYKPMEELGRQQEELGRQQEAFGREQEKLGRQQQLASIPTPDLSKEMADLNAAVAKMQAQKGAMLTQEQLSDLEGKIGELQGKLGGLQGEIGTKMGEFGGMQGKLGEQQGKLGEKQGLIGAEQGRIAVEADKKVKSIIDESLKNGKARPVE
jgi:hypothetical protein